MSEYKLTIELLKLSESQKWDEAKVEWELIDIQMVEEKEECLCGHYPILEVCLIKNKKTNSKARVGNSCVKKFNNQSDKIFKSVAKIKKSEEKSVNIETLAWAIKNKWISDNDYNFYINILKKRNLSDKQLAWKKSINKKIENKVYKK